MASRLRQRMQRQNGLTYEVVVVAQHAAELPLPPGARALFLLKRKARLCVTEPEAVDGAGGVEWNTRCTQTATLYKAGDSWQPKHFVFKVQAVRCEGGRGAAGAEQAQTVAKASIDLSQFCTAEPFGPKQLVIPLQPCGMLAVSVHTQWLRQAEGRREADSLTDVSFLSLGTAQTAATSVACGGATGPAFDAEQDLSGFDGAAAAAAGTAPTDSIRAVYPPGGAVPAAVPAGGGGGSSPVKSRLSSAVSRLRLGSAVKEASAADFEFGRRRTAGAAGAAAGAAGAAAGHPPLHRSVTMPALGGGSGAAGARRPSGASPLQLPNGGSSAGAEAFTPVMFGAQRRGAWAGAEQQQQQQQAATGLPPEAWSPVDLQEAVQQLYDSEEEPTPRATMLGTVKRMFGRARNPVPTPSPGALACHLDSQFNTPQASPACTSASPMEVATIDREGSMSALRRRCKRLVAERDEARAQGYVEATLAVELGVEVDKLRRAKEQLLLRLQVTEEQLLATFRDEASTDLIQALAAARVEAAQHQFHAMEVQCQLKRRDALIDCLRAQLTKAEAKYRKSAADSPAAAAGAVAAAADRCPSRPAPAEQPARRSASLAV